MAITKPAVGLPKASVRTVGQSAAAESALVNTATLVRGRVYVFRHEGENIQFELDVAKVVDDALASKLEDLVSEVHDTDGDAFEKPLFHVRRGVPRPEKGAAPVSKRLIMRLPPRPGRMAS